MDSCLLCGGPVSAVKSEPMVSYCERCGAYMVPSGYYSYLDLRIRAKGRGRIIRKMASLQGVCAALARIEARKGRP